MWRVRTSDGFGTLVNFVLRPRRMTLHPYAQKLEEQSLTQAELQPLDFDEITSKAEAVLKRYQQRQEGRHTLRELNRSHKSRKRMDASDHKHASNHKRKRSKSK
ncbi:GD15694 [Drosophila simulans]|uniref:GD15694 n=1 Tax=Drosophila simulans TaxID=7240 RepID=B4R6D5_DROSI|nr:GD15694 [Drosophila simulans]